jgi:glycerol kinase
MISDWQSMGQSLGQSILRIDGGMVANDWMAQSLADILQAPVHRPEIIETTALGVAWLAGMSIGLYPAQHEFANSWALNREFLPKMSSEDASQRYAGWKEAVGRLLIDKQAL